ncbi:hypothetical protein SAMN04488067_1084 [Halorubrum xinjiangense]|uniref:Uncharacterized protein n=1 Tax=Halorubrum xinjiangense TaxID=261291 RepID=A0A1G7NJW0_9EURY|nr:hypothetical protein SAMN04488067_1084 [Halorubrum xinjiangense]
MAYKQRNVSQYFMDSPTVVCGPDTRIHAAVFAETVAMVAGDDEKSIIEFTTGSEFINQLLNGGVGLTDTVVVE